MKDIFNKHLAKHPLLRANIVKIHKSIEYDCGVRFSINIIDDILYLLWVKIPEEDRGKGHGDNLYRILENIAAECGCRQIRQTPSGSSPSGETRESYLMRRGWLKDGNEVYKVTDNVDDPCSS